MSDVIEQLERNASTGSFFVAFELSKMKWKLAFSDGSRIRHVDVDARDCSGVLVAIQRAKERFGLGEGTPVRSCYEAGRDGFWIHEWLAAQKIENVVVDPASIEVNRHARRAKTDRLDADKLVTMLQRYHGGERRVWRVARVPSRDATDIRQMPRGRERLVRERTKHTARIKSLLFAEGIVVRSVRRIEEVLESARRWDGSPLGTELLAEIRRDHRRWALTNQQIKQLDDECAERVAASVAAIEAAGEVTHDVSGVAATDTDADVSPNINEAATPAASSTAAEAVEPESSTVATPETAETVRKVAGLMALCGIGSVSAWLFATEFFGWRKFKNRRQVGSLAGLTPTPFASGGIQREQGISKAGNKRVRALSVEIAWSWLRYQPNSKHSLWFQKRFGSGGGRMKRIGIVALARHVLIDLWRYSERGILPEGAVLKKAA